MFKDKRLFEQFEQNLKKMERSDYLKNIELFEEMLKEAIYLEVIPLKDPLEGIETDLKVAKIINSV